MPKLLRCFSASKEEEEEKKAEIILRPRKNFPCYDLLLEENPNAMRSRETEDVATEASWRCQNS